MLTWGESAAPVRTAEAISAKAIALNAKIGDTVNYTESSGEVTSWRLFYASDIEVFLISSNVVSSVDAFSPDGTNSFGIPLAPREKYTWSGSNYSYSNNSDKYTGAVDVFGTSYGELYNKNWFIATEGKTADTQNRSKATAYLCDSTNWTKYVGSSAPNGTYAVGGPTKELMVRSWKASGQSSDSLTNLLADTTATTAGYAYDKPTALRNNAISSDILKEVINESATGKGLYNTGDAHYWLASPCSYDTSRVCCVYYGGGNINSLDHDQAVMGIRPVVSIPITEVSISGTTISIK